MRLFCNPDVLATFEIDAKGGATHLLKRLRVYVAVHAASDPMRVKLANERLRFLSLLQSPDGFIHRVTEDDGICIQRDEPATRMSCRNSRNNQKEQRSYEFH